MSNSATVTATGDTLKAGNPQGCPAGANAEKPAAGAGNLCAYVGENVGTNAKVTGPYKPYGILQEGAGTAGAFIDIEGGSGLNLITEPGPSRPKAKTQTEQQRNQPSGSEYPPGLKDVTPPDRGFPRSGGTSGSRAAPRVGPLTLGCDESAPTSCQFCDRG